VHKTSRYNHTSSKLLNDKKGDTSLGRQVLRQDDRAEYSYQGQSINSVLKPGLNRLAAYLWR
jgi:hypothetical protein